MASGTASLRLYRPMYLLILSLVSVSGCYGTEVVKIRIRVDSKVDMKQYGSIAVADFIDSREKTPTDDGRILARMVRKQLKNNKEFQVLNEKSMRLEPDMEIDESQIGNPEALVSICGQLGVDALIVGTFDFDQRRQPIPYIVERYSPRTGTYAPETRTQIQRVHHLSIHAKVVDGKTGKTVFDYSPPSEEKPEFRSDWGLPLPSRGSDPASMRSMAVRPVTIFVLSLVPHYEYERRTLVR